MWCINDDSSEKKNTNGEMETSVILFEILFVTKSEINDFDDFQADVNR